MNTVKKIYFYVENNIIWIQLILSIIKTSGSVLGLKHTKKATEGIRKSKLGINFSKERRLIAATSSATALPVLVTEIKTNDNKAFTSMRTASNYVGMHHSYMAKSINNKGFYSNNMYIVTLSKKNIHD